MTRDVPADRGATEHFESWQGIAALWFGFLAGPVAWFLHLNVSYNLVRHICLRGDTWLLHATTLATLLVAAAGVLVALGSWRRVGEPEITTGEGTLGRTRFLALGGITLSAFFLAVILVGWIPDFLLDPCPTGL